MNILGINAFHGDASACLIIDDKIVAAAEEERFSRIKHSAGIPINAIKFCLDFSKLNINEIDHIAINRDPRKRIQHKIIYSLKKIFKYKFLKDRVLNIKKINSIKSILQENFNQQIKAKIHYVDHHIAHVASSVFFFSFRKNKLYIYRWVWRFC